MYLSPNPPSNRSEPSLSRRVFRDDGRPGPAVPIWRAGCGRRCPTGFQVLRWVRFGHAKPYSHDHHPARNRRGVPCGRPIHAQQGNHKGCPYIGRCDRTGMGPGSRIVRCGGIRLRQTKSRPHTPPVAPGGRPTHTQQGNHKGCPYKNPHVPCRG